MSIPLHDVMMISLLTFVLGGITATLFCRTLVARMADDGLLAKPKKDGKR